MMHVLVSTVECLFDDLASEEPPGPKVIIKFHAQLSRARNFKMLIKTKLPTNEDVYYSKSL